MYSTIPLTGYREHEHNDEVVIDLDSQCESVATQEDNKLQIECSFGSETSL